MAKSKPRKFSSRSKRGNRRVPAEYKATSFIDRQLRSSTRVYRMIKHVDKGTVTPLAAAVGGGYVFSLSELPETSSIINLYEVYRIDKVTLHFVPSGLPVNASQQVNPLYIAFDQIVNTTPTGLNTMLDYTGLKIITPGQRTSISFRPRPQIASNGTDSILPSQSSSWIAITNSSLSHYGLRLYIPATVGYSGTFFWRVTAEYHISLRGTF